MEKLEYLKRIVNQLIDTYWISKNLQAHDVTKKILPGYHWVELGHLFPLMLLFSRTSTPLLSTTANLKTLLFPTYFLFYTLCFHLTHLHSVYFPPYLFTKNILFRDNKNPLINKSLPSYSCPPRHSIWYDSLSFFFWKLTLPWDQRLYASTSQTILP